MQRFKQTLSSFRWYPFALGILILILLIAAGFASNYIQSIILMVTGAVVALLAAQIEQSSPELLWRALSSVLFVGLFASTLFFAYKYLYENCTPQSSPYPRDDGLIADFTTGVGGPARTNLGTEFSLLSDNAWNLSSKVWYEHRDETTDTGSRNGYMRIYYQLEPDGQREPYVGVFTDFSFPPARLYTLSRFQEIAIRLRCSSPVPVATDGLVVAIVLHSATNSNLPYIFPTFEIPSQDLRQDWVSVFAAFREFRSPHFVADPVNLDLRQVYGIGIVVYGQPDKPAHGYLDIDDLTFK